MTEVSKRTIREAIMSTFRDNGIPIPSLDPSMADVLRAIGFELGRYALYVNGFRVRYISVDQEGSIVLFDENNEYIGKYGEWELSVKLSDQGDNVYDLLAEVFKRGKEEVGNE